MEKIKAGFGVVLTYNPRLVYCRNCDQSLTDVIDSTWCWNCGDLLIIGTREEWENNFYDENNLAGNNLSKPGKPAGA